MPPGTGVETSGDGAQGSGADTSAFLKKVAAYSLGIPGIAWAVWRRSLASAVTAEAHPEGRDRKTEPVEGGEPAYPIWVKPWSQINLPEVPSQQNNRESLIILHTLLIHGGLWSRVLPELVPFSATEILEHLYFLEAAGLLQSDQGFWRVSPVGYPRLRQALVIEGYLTDDL